MQPSNKKPNQDQGTARREILGKPVTLTSSFNFLKNYEVERLLRYVLPIRQKTLGIDDLHVANNLNRVALVLSDQNKHENHPPGHRR